MRSTSTLPSPASRGLRTSWGKGGVWRGKGRKQSKTFSKVRTKSMIEMSGAYDRDPYVAADSKCKLFLKHLKISLILFGIPNILAFENI